MVATAARTLQRLLDARVELDDGPPEPWEHDRDADRAATAEKARALGERGVRIVCVLGMGMLLRGKSGMFYLDTGYFYAMGDSIEDVVAVLRRERSWRTVPRLDPYGLDSHREPQRSGNDTPASSGS